MAKEFTLKEWKELVAQVAAHKHPEASHSELRIRFMKNGGDSTTGVITRTENNGYMVFIYGLRDGKSREEIIFSMPIEDLANAKFMKTTVGDIIHLRWTYLDRLRGISTRGVLATFPTAV